MKNMIFITTMIFSVCFTAKAQTDPKLNKSEIKPIQSPRKILKTPTVGTNPAPATNTNYYLTSIKVKIFTGNDNKEALSKISLYLFRSGTGPLELSNPNREFVLSGGPYFDPGELKINSNTELPMELAYTRQESFYGIMGLDRIQLHGLKLQISYLPNFILDAWKIDKVAMTLEFKDDQGNPHPTMGSKTITFINASALLTDKTNSLICETDGFFMPKN